MTDTAGKLDVDDFDNGGRTVEFCSGWLGGERNWEFWEAKGEAGRVGVGSVIFTFITSGDFGAGDLGSFFLVSWRELILGVRLLWCSARVCGVNDDLVAST